MNNAELAEALRQRQISFGAHPEDFIRSLSDDEIIDSYVRCSECGYRPATGALLAAIIEGATSADEFIEGLDAIDNHTAHDRLESERIRAAQQATAQAKARRKRRRRESDVWEDKLRDGKDSMGVAGGGLSMYEVYHYIDDLGGTYESPHLHDTTDDLQDAQRQVRKRGGYVRRVSDGAEWDPGTEQWFGDEGPL